MDSADFSQFVVTTANGTACETSTLKARALSPHLSAAFTGTSGNFWASSFRADLPIFPSLICGSYPSDQGFAYSFLQIPPRDGHPCCSAVYFVVAYAYSGLSPVRARPWRANKKKAAAKSARQPFLNMRCPPPLFQYYLPAETTCRVLYSVTSLTIISAHTSGDIVHVSRQIV